INLVTALTSSFFISKFSGLISQIVALAVLMPMVASLGGNAGTQTLAVAVRALSARELNRNNAMKVVFREAMTGVLNGLVIATVLATVAGLWFHNPTISLTIGLAVTMNFVAAGLAGILVPLTLEKFGQDPAVSSGVIVTFVTDMVGFVAFLGLATLIVSQ
ncbi:MAG: magnesium transporter, partial [Hyphomonadaceae bacterium]